MKRKLDHILKKNNRDELDFISIMIIFYLLNLFKFEILNDIQFMNTLLCQYDHSNLHWYANIYGAFSSEKRYIHKI